MKKFLSSVLEAIFATITALVVGLIGIFSRHLASLIVDRHTQTAIIHRNDPLGSSVLKWCTENSDMGYASRWRAGIYQGYLSEQSTINGSNNSTPGAPSGADSDEISKAFRENQALRDIPPAWGKPNEDGKLSFVPGLSKHSIRFEGAKITVRLVSHSTSRDGWMTVVEVSTLSRNPNTLRRFLQVVADYHSEEIKKEATILIADISSNRIGSVWSPAATRKMRPASSVILPDDIMNDIVSDLRRFLADKEWYAEMGIPWRRGVGLFGPPGTGKSSCIQAVVRELGLNLYVLRLAEDGMTDSKLDEILRSVPAGSVVQIEDIDVAMVSNSREEVARDEEFLSMLDSGTASFVKDCVNHGIGLTSDNNAATAAYNRMNRSRVTMSGLLNALDSATAAEGRILFVTSNYPERLDSALMRRGRIDRHFHLGYATRDQIKRMFLRFFPFHEDRAEEFATAYEGRTDVSMADVQEYLLEHRDDAMKAIAGIYEA